MRELYFVFESQGCWYGNHLQRKLSRVLYEKSLLLLPMKKIIALLLISLSVTVSGLDGLEQARIERVYDIYRERYIAGKSTEEQSHAIQQTQMLVQNYRDMPTTPPARKEIFAYFQHLLCEAESVIDGTECQDTYITPGILTIAKDNLILAQIRTYLIKEHSDRRVARNLGPLTESTILDAIAQKYALDLCQA